MFVCGECGKQSQRFEKSYLKVLETRRKVYPPRRDANPVKTPEGRYTTDDPGGQGWETVREALVCGECV